MIRPLKQETLDIPHIVIELIMLPRDIESCFCTTHGDTERGAVNRQDLITFTLPWLAVEAFSNIDA